MKNKAEKGEKLMERVEPLGLKFALLDRKFRELIETKASDLGFTAVQLSVLAQISHIRSESDKEIHQRDLEEIMNVTHPTMTDIIKRLEKKNAITCVPSNTDKRSKSINISKEYLNIHSEMMNADEEVFVEMCRDVPERDIKIFLKTLDLMLEKISRNDNRE